MQSEYLALIIMTFFFMFAWLPGSIGKWKSYGTKWLLSNRNPLAGRELRPWAARSDRAYNNLKDYFPAFVVAIIVLGALGKFDEGTKWAATIYVVARVSHFIFYAIGNMPVRSISFFVGLATNAYLLIKTF